MLARCDWCGAEEELELERSFPDPPGISHCFVPSGWSDTALSGVVAFVDVRGDFSRDLLCGVCLAKAKEKILAAIRAVKDEAIEANLDSLARHISEVGLAKLKLRLQSKG